MDKDINIDALDEGVAALQCLCDMAASCDDLHMVSGNELATLLRLIGDHIKSGYRE